MKTIIVMTSLAVLQPTLDVAAASVPKPESVAESEPSKAADQQLETWTPVADVAEDDSQYNIILELPGLARGDFDVQVEDEWIYVSGERAMPEENDGKLYNRIERRIGVFERKFRVPQDADASSISAHYRDGLLTVTLLKEANSGRKPIAIEFT